MASETIFAKICLVFCLIALVKSQTVYIDVSTGRIVSVAKGQNLTDRINISSPNHGGNQHHSRWICQNSDTGFEFSLSHEIVLSSFPDLVQQPQTDNTLKPRIAEETTLEWICTNDKTNDTIILSTEEIADRSPKTISKDSLYFDFTTKAPFPEVSFNFPTVNKDDAVSWGEYAKNNTKSINEKFGEELIDIRMKKQN